MYMQLSFVSSSTASVESVEITLGEQNRPLMKCVLDKMSVDLIREFFEKRTQQSCNHITGFSSPSATEEIKPSRLELLVNKDGAEIRQLVSSIEAGLEVFEPEMCDEGVNGTYFLKDSEGKTVGIFKSKDEEGKSKSNPKYSDEAEETDLNKGLLEGEGVYREVAAYLLDHGHFSGVPLTTLVNIDKFKGESSSMGSLQEFVENDGASWDIGPKAFPTREVHKIGILDLRILNSDRHGGNILMKRMGDGTIQLIPIDHGFSLPDKLDRAWFDWISWPQSKMPLDGESLEYIASLDIEEDAKILKELGIRSECIRTMRLSTSLLKKGALNGLNLFEIGSMASRLEMDTPSELEVMYERCLDDLSMTSEDLFEETAERIFLENLDRIFDEAIESKREARD